jgi:phosphate/sulfate permease
MIKRSLEALLVAAYWFAGGSIFAWWTPYALEAGLIGSIIGLVLFAWVRLIEDRGGHVPPLLGLLLLAPPLSLLLAGAIIWVLERFVSPLLPD